MFRQKARVLKIRIIHSQQKDLILPKLSPINTSSSIETNTSPSTESSHVASPKIIGEKTHCYPSIVGILVKEKVCYSTTTIETNTSPSTACSQLCCFTKNNWRENSLLPIHSRYTREGEVLLFNHKSMNMNLCLKYLTLMKNRIC